MPSFIEILEAILYSGIKVYHRDNYSVKDELEDKFLYCGKNDPEKYFDPEIRKGISSFSSLSHQDEVEKGLAQLRKDIDEGQFASIRDSYQGEDGDYFYLTLFK